VDSRLTTNLRVSPDVEALSRAAAAGLADVIDATVAGGASCSLALAGGTTPRALYRLLATAYRERIPWGRVYLFWGDERYVPPEDPRSNYRLVRETLLDHVPIPAENVHPMPTQFPDPNGAARAYAETMRAYFPGPWPRFDLVLLGLGADGHIASLFPGSAALDERDRWVTAARAPAEPSQRLTLTLPALNHAARVWFLVAGTEKARALRRALVDAPRPHHCPAVGVRPVDGAAVWWVDDAAAALVAGRSDSA